MMHGGPDTLYRCLHAAALHRKAPHLPVVVCGGADGQGGPAYAYVMRDFLLGQGVKATSVGWRTIPASSITATTSETSAAV